MCLEGLKGQWVRARVYRAKPEAYYAFAKTAKGENFHLSPRGRHVVELESDGQFQMQMAIFSIFDGVTPGLGEEILICLDYLRRRRGLSPHADIWALADQFDQARKELESLSDLELVETQIILAPGHKVGEFPEVVIDKGNDRSGLESKLGFLQRQVPEPAMVCRGIPAPRPHYFLRPANGHRR